MKIIPELYDESLTNAQRLTVSRIMTRTDGGPLIHSAKLIAPITDRTSVQLYIWLDNGTPYRIDKSGYLWALISASIEDQPNLGG